MKLLNILILVFTFSYLNADLVRVSDTIIQDTKTKFLWEDTKEVKTQKRTFNEALLYCNNLKINDETNWKVPTFVALFSIVNTKLYNPTLSKEFNHFVSDNYWTNKTFGHATSGEAFVVDFLSGAFNRKSMDDKFYVRCYKEVN